MHKRLLFLLVAAYGLCCGVLQAQVTFYSDAFTGGVITGGFGVGTNSAAGSGSFNMPVPAGSTIRRAYLFGTQLGGAAPDITVQLNGTPYTFDATNGVGPTFQSPNYGGDAQVHAIDLTADLDPTVTSYTIDVPGQPNFTGDVYTEFYLLIAYALASGQTVNVEVYFSDQDCQQTLTYTLNTTAPMISTLPVGFCVMGGYAAAASDCETITVNGTTLGSFWGGDFNSTDPTFGSTGTMSYDGISLVGLGDDDADQAIDGTDVVSDLSALVPDLSSSVDVRFDHCPGGSENDNHVWLMVLAYSSSPCDITLDLGTDQGLCTGEEVVLDATQTIAGATYSWQDGSTTPTFTATQTGTYWVEVRTAMCTRSDTVQVTVSEPPVIDLGPDTSLCAGGSLLLDAGAPGASYLWSTGANTPTVTVTSTQEIWVLATNTGGCAGSDTVTVTFHPLPVFTLSDDSVCVDRMVTLDAGNPGARYRWSTGDTTRTITINGASGLYRVVATLPSGCSDSTAVRITFVDFPVIDLGPDTSLCEGLSLELDATTPESSITWSTGFHGPVQSITTQGIYWVDVDNGSCVSRDSIEVTFYPLPLPVVEAERALCLAYPPYTTELDAGNAGAHFIWSTGDTTATLLTGAYGRFGVTIITPEGCSLKDTITVLESCPPQVWVPNSFTPNGDGQNDLFTPSGYNITAMDLSIYDRWGALVHRDQGPSTGWDGRVNSEDAPNGVYVWRIRYRAYGGTNGHPGPGAQEAIGHVTLFR